LPLVRSSRICPHTKLQLNQMKSL